MRIDRYLWMCRFFKTRGLAAEVVSKGRVRLNGRKLHKASSLVRVSDILNFVQARNARMIEVCGIPERRGPAEEAAEYFSDVDHEFGTGSEN